MKDENQDHELFFFNYCTFGRPANIVYCLDASPFLKTCFSGPFLSHISRHDFTAVGVSRARSCQHTGEQHCGHM